MSQPSSNKSVVSVEPQVGSATVPIWIVMALLIAVFAGGLYFDAKGGWFNDRVYAPYANLKEVQLFQPVVGDDWMGLGQRKYEQVCALCHGVDGTGKPGQAPPFVGSEWVLTDTIGRLIRIPLNGVNGPIKVKGQEWTLSMPAMGSGMTDEELAAVLSYMRNSWGNKASVIKPADVKAVRSSVAARTQQWTADELMKVQ
ncbi:MAG: hypothetical protein RLY20_1932 [Verrucomicrobiota bacterium]|jgi:mono/diheme cytochrome c family protein